MAEIHKFKTIKDHFNEETVEILTELLEMAKKGEVVEIACVAWRPNGDQTIRISSITDTLKKLGAFSQLQFELLLARAFNTAPE
jgi:hypothetical protein